MSEYKDKEDLEKEDILDEMQEEISKIENEEWEIDEEKLADEVTGGEHAELERLKEALARKQADYENFKKRTERDREDMVFFLKSDILKKILGRVDDIERIIKNTPEEMREGTLFEGILSLEKSLKKDLNSMWVTEFISLWEEIDPDKHEVMTKVPGWKEGIITDEFEKWYMLWDRVLRVAKVVVWSWE